MSSGLYRRVNERWALWDQWIMRVDEVMRLLGFPPQMWCILSKANEKVILNKDAVCPLFTEEDKAEAFLLANSLVQLALVEKRYISELIDQVPTHTEFRVDMDPESSREYDQW